MSTIKDVAKAANVSVSTVSNVINNKTSVNIDIYNRVVKAMKELDYQPNVMAMNLRKNNLNLIGVVYSQISETSSIFLEGSLQVIAEAGYIPAVMMAKSSELNLEYAINRLSASGVKKVIVISPYIKKQSFEELLNRKIPVLSLGYSLDLNGVYSAWQNKRVIVLNMLQRFFNGSSRFGFISGDLAFSSENSAYQGYLEYLDKNNLEPFNNLQLPYDYFLADSKLLNYFYEHEDIPDEWFLTDKFFLSQLQYALYLYQVKKPHIYVLSGQQIDSVHNDTITYIPENTLGFSRQSIKQFFIETDCNHLPDSYERSEQLHIQMEDSTTRTKYIMKEKGDILHVLLPDVPMSRSVGLLSRDFTNRTNIRVEFTIKNQTELLSEILNNKKSYDAIVYHINWEKELCDKKRLVSLRDYIDLDTLSKTYTKTAQNIIFPYINPEYGLLIELGTQILVYRGDIFNDPVIRKNFYNTVGIELEPPKSWSEFNIVARYFTKKFNKYSPVLYGTCMAGHNPIGLVEELWPRSAAFNARFWDENGACFDSPQNIRALRNLCDTYKYSYPDCQTYMDKEQVNELLQGNIAMIVTYSNHVLFADGIKNYDFRFSQTPSNTTIFDGYLIGLSASTAKQKEAASFIKWYCSDEISLRSSLLGKITPKHCIRHNDGLLLLKPEIEHSFNIDDPIYRSDILPTFEGLDYERLMGNQIAKALYEETPPAIALYVLQQEINKKL